MFYFNFNETWCDGCICISTIYYYNKLRIYLIVHLLESLYWHTERFIIRVNISVGINNYIILIIEL